MALMCATGRHDFKEKFGMESDSYGKDLRQVNDSSSYVASSSSPTDDEVQAARTALFELDIDGTDEANEQISGDLLGSDSASVTSEKGDDSSSLNSSLSTDNEENRSILSNQASISPSCERRSIFGDYWKQCAIQNTEYGNDERLGSSCPILNMSRYFPDSVHSNSIAIARQRPFNLNRAANDEKMHQASCNSLQPSSLPVSFFSGKGRDSPFRTTSSSSPPSPMPSILRRHHSERRVVSPDKAIPHPILRRSRSDSLRKVSELRSFIYGDENGIVNKEKNFVKGFISHPNNKQSTIMEDTPTNVKSTKMSSHSEQRTTDRPGSTNNKCGHSREDSDFDSRQKHRLPQHSSSPSPPHADPIPIPAKSKEPNEHGSTSCSCHHGVHFDPRVTVLEFGESRNEKQHSRWFTSEELERFKNEAIELAQKYASSSPLAAATRMEEIVDPVTGTRRQKALFTNPALCATEEDTLVPEGSSKLFEFLATEIQNILVVDAHERILELFQRAIHHMLPHANIVTSQSGEDALRRIEAAMVAFGNSKCGGKGTGQHGFDIVIADERLHRRGCNPDGTNRDAFPDARPQSWTPTSSFSNLTEQTAGEEQKQRVRPISGSQLLQRIAALEDEYFNSAHHDYDKVPYAHLPSLAPLVTKQCSRTFGKGVESSQYQRRSLLIGVSACLGEDCEKLQRGGADILWGKPPPKMDNRVRNQLLSALLTKRMGSTYICG